MWFSRQVSAYLQWLDQDLGQVPLPTFPPPFCAESIFILNLQGQPDSVPSLMIWEEDSGVSLLCSTFLLPRKPKAPY